MEKPLEYTAEESGERLDSFLARQSGLSRSYIQKLLEEGHGSVNGQAAKASLKLNAGDLVLFQVPAPKDLNLKAENIPLQVHYEDEHLLVLHKPAGLVVHPGAGHWEGTLVNALLHHCGNSLATAGGIGGELRPGIVHRIDKNTSGILVVTKSDAAHASLSEQFKKHTITRKYLAIVWGETPQKGEWHGSIGRDPKHRQRMAVVENEGARKALTTFQALRSLAGPATLIECELFTGRTHQIRVHFSQAGFPLVGDSLYQNVNNKAHAAREKALRFLEKKPAFLGPLKAFLHRERQALHAAELHFTHPISGKRLSFREELPEDLQMLLTAWEKI